MALNIIFIMWIVALVANLCVTLKDIENSKEFLLYRKQIILSSLLHNFRKTNYLHLDSFINFSMTSYIEFLEEIIDMVIQLFLSNSTSLEYLNFVIKNMFED